MGRRSLIACAALALLAAPARAQDLAHIDTLLATGRFSEARSTFERWRTQHPRNARSVSSEVHARALLLEGRIAREPEAALDAYLALVLGYPTAPETPRALLLLGQGLLATNQPERARGYLERRTRDYPAAPGRAEALLWLARAQRASAHSAAACATLADAAAPGTDDPVTRELLEHERREACTPSAPTPARNAAPSQTSATPRPALPDRPAQVQRFAVQAGAFRTPERAQRLARTLAERGFKDARVVYVPTSTLARVRLGHFASSADAAAAAQRLRAAGFDAAVVTDAHTERARR